jgi:MYXO-CTERM domain-containing protein
VPHGNRKACTGSAPCVGTCNGHLTTECTYPNNTSCGSTVGCSDGGETAQRCNGFGDCVELPTKTCAPFVCGAGECKTSCETDSDCAFGYTCHPKSGCVLANQPACVDGSDRGCPSPAAAPGDEGGCGCRVGAARRDYGGLLGAMLLGGAWLSRRKRR